ncbi:recombinase family protein [Streptomyces sp. NPDC056045]|uniref:recombinase family protein n=1 Tax=Streptomyces sp. NPDC056045 TaxID=3345691 RepID=UPI0035D8D13A
MPDTGYRKIFADKKSGKNALRPELKACHAFLDAGDTLVVPSLDRYGRSLQSLINMVAELRDCGIGFTSLHENLATAPDARAVRSCHAPGQGDSLSPPGRTVRRLPSGEGGRDGRPLVDDSAPSGGLIQAPVRRACG